MKLKITATQIILTPERDIEWAYIRDTMRMRDHGDTCSLMVSYTGDRDDKGREELILETVNYPKRPEGAKA